MYSFLRLSVVAIVALTTSLVSTSSADKFASVSDRTVAGDPLTSVLIEAGRNQASQSSRSSLRDRLISSADLSRYGLAMEENWQRQTGDKPVVVLIHGFNSTAEDTAALLAPAREAQFPCGMFSYPNDQSIVASARLLASELAEFARLHPGRAVILLTHSMGGLVARACIEDPLLNPGNVMRLVMVAPPSHGTLIAHFAVGTDLWEHWLARRDGWPWTRARDSIVDGLGEAADDLCPGSAFLVELNDRPRNRQVDYSVLLGTGAMMTDDEMEWIRTMIRRTAGNVPGIRGRAMSFDEMLAQMDELVDGKGDGVVAVERGRLDQVSDTLILPFGHLTVTRELSDEDEVLREVQRAVFVRLE